jgi:hypothetical protein
MYYCTDVKCEKFTKGYCKTPKEGKQDDKEIMNCTCKDCAYDYDSNPCEEWLGDMYNTDGDCLAMK